MYLLVNYVNHLENERLPFAIDILHPYRIKKSRVQEFVEKNIGKCTRSNYMAMRVGTSNK